MVLAAILAFDGITMFHLSTPALVFDEVRRQGFGDWRNVVFSETGAPVRTAEGCLISELANLSVTEEADMVIVPAWSTELHTPSLALTAALRSAHSRGATIVGLCLGAIVVADAGLLKGRPAVTHWKAFEILRERHPEIALQQTVLYVDHGDVVTSAGTASGLDACLNIVRNRLGADVAGQVAKELVVAPHRGGGQAQYIDGPRPRTDAAEPISAVLEWALQHLAEPLDVEALADKAQMSRRTFIRSFTKATGVPPATWLRQQRLNQARRLLETTDLPVERAASACGLFDASTFRRQFRASFGHSPSEYRRHYSTRPITRLTD